MRPGGLVGAMRRGLGGVFLASRLDAALARLAARPGIVLALHRVVARVPDGPMAGLCVSAEELGACIALLRRRGHVLLSMSEAARRLREGTTPARFAVLGFDDGYRDNHDLLPELLERHEAPATVYVTTGFIDRTAPMWWYGLAALLRERGVVVLGGVASSDYAALRDRVMQAEPEAAQAMLAAVERETGCDLRAVAEAEAMDWPMLRRIAGSRWIEIGAHGVRHLPSARLDAAAALAELAGSAARLDVALGRAPAHFAFPYGDAASVTQRDARLARDCGYATAASTIIGALRPTSPLHALPRLVLGGTGMPARLRVALCGLLDQPGLAAGPIEAVNIGGRRS